MTAAVARVDDPAIAEPPSPPTLRNILRSATSVVHNRLHSHDGLAAVAAGTIDRASYTALLGRLYGFHHSFEQTTQTVPERTRWLESDLAALGVDGGMLAGLPRCTVFPASASPDYLLGAGYVVEGSALGGRGLARQLDGLLGTGLPRAGSSSAVTAPKPEKSGFPIWRGCRRLRQQRHRAQQ